ncbi:MAG TPA: HAMP domain-containing sensor histidine kinase, partial [Terriglobales bacterium]
PLEAISNCFFVLRDHPSLSDEARALARLGEQELERVCHITRQTLSFYRESQQPVTVSISDILNDVLELQSRPLQLNRITLERDYSSKGWIHGFPVELKQVFLNLISNAIQAMPNGGRLRIRVFDSALRNPRGSGTYVSIVDNGVGISAEHAKRLFEPFFTTKSTKGTGLGLWISKGIIQKYDGSLRCRSVSVGQGKATCFTVFIPDTLSAAKILSMNSYMESETGAPLVRRSVGSA